MQMQSNHLARAVAARCGAFQQEIEQMKVQAAQELLRVTTEAFAAAATMTSTNGAVSYRPSDQQKLDAVQAQIDAAVRLRNPALLPILTVRPGRKAAWFRAAQTRIADAQHTIAITDTKRPGRSTSAAKAVPSTPKQEPAPGTARRVVLEALRLVSVTTARDIMPHVSVLAGRHLLIPLDAVHRHLTALCDMNLARRGGKSNDGRQLYLIGGAA